MDLGEQLNLYGKRIRSNEDYFPKRRRLQQAETVEMVEGPSLIAIQLLRKPGVEARARRELELYRAEMWRLSGCGSCRRE